jgi:hypothetical protein
MTHLEEGHLLALRDDPDAAPDEHARHLETCPACRDALQAARLQAGAVAAALDGLDADAGDLERARQAVRLRVAALGADAARGSSLPARATRRAFWSLSRAAGILLVTAAGLSALPGSPVRAWIENLVSPAAEEAAAPAPGPTAEVAAPQAPPEEAGVRLPLAGGPLAVVLHGASPGTEIRVTWIPGNEAALFAPVGSRFTSGEGRLEATLAPGPVRVEIRRGMSPLSLEVDGSTLLQSTRSGLDVKGTVVERGDAGITFVVPPR